LIEIFVALEVGVGANSLNKVFDLPAVVVKFIQQLAVYSLLIVRRSILVDDTDQRLGQI
jgi:hypothetical protein